MPESQGVDVGQRGWVRVETLLDEATARRPDHLALIFRERCWTYAALHAETDRRAAVLVAAGMEPGDVVLMAAPADDAIVIGALACCRANLTVAYLPPNAAAAEFTVLAERAHARMLLTPDGAPHPAAPDIPTLPIGLPGQPDDATSAETARRSAMGTAEDIAMLQSTSGSTGSAVKWVRRSHRAFTWRAQSPAWDTDPETILYLHRTSSPNLANICRSLGTGQTVMLGSTLDPAQMEAEMARHGATRMTSVPAVYRLLTECPQPPPRDLHLAILRSASAALPLAVSDALVQRYGARLLLEYASTECGSTIETPESGAPRGSIGTPVSGATIRLVDDAGIDVPDCETGELLVRSPGVMSGYMDDDMATGQTLRDGWIWTGDLMRRDTDGFLYVEGRRTLRISVSGYKVIPEEVETVLETHPGVREAAVTAMADRTRGEAVRAIIVPRGERPAIPALRRFCQERLASYKVPRAWEFRDALPRSPLGKLLRNKL